MTVQTTSVSSPTYPGNGVATQFPTVFMFYDNAQVVPVLIDSDGLETDMTTGFVVSGATLDNGGTVTTAVPVPSGSSIRIDRRTPLTQEVDVRNLGNFAPRVHMEAWDRLAMQVQEQGAGAIRAPRSVGTGFDGTIRYFDPLKPLVVSADGTGIEGGDNTLTGDMLLRPNLADGDAGKGADLVAFPDSVAPTYLKTVSDIANGLPVSVMRFVDPTQAAAIRNFTSTYDADDDLADALASGVRSLLLPVGLFNLNTKLVRTGNLSLVGQGIGATRLLWRSAATDTGLQVTLAKPASWTDTCSVYGLDLITEKVAQGYALNIISPAGASGDRVSPRAVVRDVLMRGATNPTIDGWLRGVWLDNCSNSLVDNCHFIGRVNGTEPNYSSTYGFVWDNFAAASPHQSAVTFRDCIVHYAQTGFLVDDFEGAQFTNCTAVGVNTGLHALGPLNFPHLRVDGGHFNASNVGILIDKIAQAIVTNALVYKELGASSGTGIEVRNNATEFQLLGNQIENLSTTVGMNGIVIDGAQRGLIDGNYFRRVNSVGNTANGTAIWVTSGSEDVVLGNRNTFAPSGINTRVLDSGTRTVRPGMGATVALSGNVSVTASSALILSWGSATQVGGFWVSGSPTRLTVPVAGRYRLSANVVWNDSTSGTRELFMRRNGSAEAGLAHDVKSVTSAFEKQSLVSAVVDAVVGDYFELLVLSSVNTAVLGPQPQTYFSIQRVE